MPYKKLPLTAAVLAGGRSLRMGRDKTVIPVEGKSLVLKVVDSVSRVCRKTVVVSNRMESLMDAGLPEDVELISDEVPWQGPLGGLTTALAKAEDQWILAVGADMPYIMPEIIHALWSRREKADIVVPVGARGPEPLLALYSTSCLPVARKVLASGRRRMIAIFRQLSVKEVPLEDLMNIDPELLSFFNINTPEDLQTAENISSRQQHENRKDSKTLSRPHKTEDNPQIADTRLSSKSSGKASSGIQIHNAVNSLGLPVERPVTLYFNEHETATIQATPIRLDELAAGFFASEGLIKDRDSLISIEVDDKRGMVRLSSQEKFPENRMGSGYITSGCGGGISFVSANKVSRKKVSGKKPEKSFSIEAKKILDLMSRMNRAAAEYRKTGGMHAAAISDGKELLIMREDVGRHNTVDKVLGRAWIDGLDLARMILLTTGRISYEMAHKCAKAGIPVLVSRTAVTNQAVQIAESMGICLAGYARGRQITVYTLPESIT